MVKHLRLAEVHRMSSLEHMLCQSGSLDVPILQCTAVFTDTLLEAPPSLADVHTRALHPEAIRRILDPLGVKVVFRPLRTLRQMLVRPKDPVPVDERKGVVYSIPCVECSSVYIGQTGRSLKQRVSEHRRALKNGDIQASALAEHVLKTGHAVDLSQSEVLDHHQHTTTRCMLESWYIQHNQAALNRERGTLPEVYTALLD